jgi:sporulation protein YabP
MDLPLPHKLTLNERQSLTVTGVEEVLNFDENTVQLRTVMGCLWVYGQQLKLKTLNPEGGLLSLGGTVHALAYEQAQKKGGKLSRLLG